MNNVIVTITGPSASGKSTLESMLCDPEGSVFSKVVSHTTREPRKGEVNGRDYHFVIPEYFDFMRRNSEFAEVVDFAGHSYAAHSGEFNRIFARQQIAVIVVEPNGKDAIQFFAKQGRHICVPVFLTNPEGVRYKRLLERFVRDIENLELDGPVMKAQLEKFANRLAVVSTVESKWRYSEFHYDIGIGSFSKSNATAVVNQVSAAALNALTARSHLTPPAKFASNL